MCVVCGCSDPAPGGPKAEGTGPAVDPATGDLHFGAGPARVSVPGMSPTRAIQLEADVLGENNRVAAANRAHFRSHGVTALNLVSSPGSGKTTLLVATLQALRQRRPDLALGVIEGDQQTANDAERIRATGVPAIQVNTGKGCHLDAPMVAEAFSRLPLHGAAHGHGHAHVHVHVHSHPHAHGPATGHVHDHAADAAHEGEHAHEHAHEHTHEHSHEHSHDHEHGDAHEHAHAHAHIHTHDHDHDAAPADPGALLFIENVGNLVCPAMWDLGEAAKVAVLSVTEGEDKPLKYPDMFAAARLMVLSKIDLLPHVDFDVERCIAHARKVNPAIEVLRLSSRTGQGMEAWMEWLLALAAGRDGETAALRQRVAELEARLKAAGLPT
jgi:hydrogenase nickel incorporation protein HypB